MIDQNKTKAQLIEELNELRQRLKVGNVEDTERKQVKEALKSEELFSALAETALVAIFIYQKDKCVYSNPKARAITGFTQEELNSMNFWEIIHPDHRELVKARGMARQHGARVPARYEVMIVTKKVETRWLNVSMAPFEFENQPAILGIGLDITERKQAEEALLESEERYRFLYTRSPAMLHSIDAEGKLVDVNDRWLDVLGYDRSEVIGRKSGDFQTKESWRYSETVAIPIFLKTGSTDELPLQFIRKSGEVIDILLSAIAERDDEGNIVRSLAFLNDVTQLKRIQQELIRLERMTARSEMVQGINHNLNNLLNGILLPAQLLKDNLEDPQDRQRAELIESAAKMSAELVRRLNRAARRKEEDPQAVEISPVVQEAMETTRSRWESEPQSRGIAVDLVTQLGDAPPIHGTASELYDVLVNLIFNAVDAMPDGGTITIRSQALADHVQLTVSDTGIGMDMETRKRVFEPFFTDKLDPGRGLGLYTVYTSISNWGGHIVVDSTLGEGTTFTMELPVWSGTPEAQGDDKIKVQSDGQMKILLVEDDEITNKVLTEQLSAEYAVEVITNGQTAVEHFTPGQYAVALIDLGIPGIPGDRVAQQLRQADFSIATVLITGFELSEDDARLTAFDLWYQKPLSVEQFDEMMEQAVSLHQSREKGHS